jgi:hypothetical protein
LFELILAIDPGSTQSAYVILDDNLKPVEFGKEDNETVQAVINSSSFYGKVDHFALEMVASYGMAVGKDVFDTVFWIGRFWETASGFVVNKKLIYRKDEKMNLCHVMKAKDSNITQALVDRFASGQANHGKGTKKEPGWFYGFSKDVWQAYAVGVTYHDLYVKKGG